MELLKNKILSEGRVLPGNIIKVDSFLNHQIDPCFIHALGREFARRFHDDKITKILTIESSGIAIAVMVGLEFGVPVVFAKKQKSKNMGNDVYSSTVKSYTKGQTYNVAVSQSYLKSDDRVLILDDFLAMGEAASGLVDIVEQSSAHLAGLGIVIEKGFQQGGKLLRERGIRVESLAIIKSAEDNRIVFG